MGASSYKLTTAQVACLSAIADGKYTGYNRCADYPHAISLTDKFAEAGSQALRNACVANAVTALVEYYEDGKNRLSAQYLIEATRLSEQAWLQRNLELLTKGLPCEADFAVAFEGPVAQIKMLVAANGSKSAVAESFVASFGKQLAQRLNADNGTRIRRAFEALEKYGICRFRLWPYANLASVADVADGSFPPGAHEDARKHRVMNGLYILRSPNNVDEIRGILSGANGRRRMPVCVGVDVFEGCDDETFAFPSCAADGSVATFKGIHEMLLVGYRDDRAFAGGGFFIVRNSWGADWGRDGYGRIPYAYIECFCREAGTILQDLVDYVGERGLPATVRTGHPVRAAFGWGLVAAALVGGGAWGFRVYRERPRIAPVIPETVAEAVTNVTETAAEATNVAEAVSVPIASPETNVEACVDPEVPIASPEPPVVEPEPPVVEPASPVLRASVSPCETSGVSTAGLQDCARRHGDTEVVQTNKVEDTSPKPVIEKVPQHVLISARGLDAKVLGFLRRRFYRDRGVSVRRGAAQGEIVLTARAYEPVRAALVEKFAVEEVEAAHWTVCEKPREYAFAVRFLCKSRDEADLLRLCLGREKMPFAVEVLPTEHADGLCVAANVVIRSAEGTVPDVRREVAEYLMKNWTGETRVNWLAPDRIRSIQKL